MKPFYVLLFSLIWSFSAQATNLVIENVRPVFRDDITTSKISVIFDISWENAWRNSKNHDAVWVFMKFNGYYNNHVKLKHDGHRILQNRIKGTPAPGIEVSSDSLGFFLSLTDTYRVDLNLKLQIEQSTTSQSINYRKMEGNFRVYGIEMVYIPQGPFTLGSPDDAAEKKAAFYKSDAYGKEDGLIRIASEAEIKVAPEAGALYYWSEEALYNGDQKGPVPAEFPKGFEAFYVMKYELTQGLYADFLNHLPDNWTFTRSPVGGRYYDKKRGGIRLEDGKYIADNPNRPMNFISFTDGLAFTDWAALRPITELEYTKAARGPAEPKPYEFVWGTDNYDLLERYVDSNSDLTLQNGWTEAQLKDENRAIFGASYYWVMDLNGSVWEKVITIGNEVGRQFKGSHGDGNLDFGHATNEDWPKSDDEVGGFGYRGGGYYNPGTIYSDFNPHSPIGHRYYGSWSGGPRSIAYGYRAGRSAE